jgi:hypothetical protein
LVFEDQDAAIPKWIQSRDVAPIEAAPDVCSPASHRELQFGPRAGPQAHIGLDESRTAGDVDEDDRLSWS